MGVLPSSRPRNEVLTGELDHAIFPAEFGDLFAGKVPRASSGAITPVQSPILWRISP